MNMKPEIDLLKHTICTYAGNGERVRLSLATGFFICVGAVILFAFTLPYLLSTVAAMLLSLMK